MKNSSNCNQLGSPSEARTSKLLTVQEMEERFGLVIKPHKIRDIDLKFIEIEQPDKLVREHYAQELLGSGDAPTWPVSWPAAYGLAEYVALQLDVTGKSMLELGCGTAITGVVAERAGADFVLATDRDCLALVLARHNAKINKCKHFRTEYLDWFRPGINSSFQYVLGSDVVYLESTYDALLETARRALVPGGLLLLSDPGRKQMDDLLLLARSKGWNTTSRKIVVHLHEASYSVRINELTLLG